ncbi:uracil-DNA glycosylase [Neisseria sp. Ec49-e6-T10]|uniref:uracil-DNA glycosylase n=1 Tax=Neisseria sp. Ec49-e6-T10 TaxID=3140744 RepID=UPI003EB8C6C0
MLEARYLLLHQALGLGKMWLKKGAHLVSSEQKVQNPASNVQINAQVVVAESVPQYVAEPLQTASQPISQSQIQTAPVEKTAQPTQVDAQPIQTDGKNLLQLEQMAQNCQNCSLCGCRLQPVFGQGNSQADVLIVSLSPSPEDDLNHQLFEGKVGVLLSNMLKSIHIPIEDTYQTTLVKCAPSFDVKVDKISLKTCQAYFDAQVRLIQPKAILALGEDMPKFAQVNDEGLHYAGIPFFHTHHPARLLRHPQDKAHAWETLKRLSTLLQHI